MSAVNGLSVGGITGGASGSTSATLTVAFNSDFHLPSTLGVRVLVTVTIASADIGAVTVDDTDSVAGGVQSTLWMA